MCDSSTANGYTTLFNIIHHRPSSSIIVHHPASSSIIQHHPASSDTIERHSKLFIIIRHHSSNVHDLWFSLFIIVVIHNSSLVIHHSSVAIHHPSFAIRHSSFAIRHALVIQHSSFIIVIRHYHSSSSIIGHMYRVQSSRPLRRLTCSRQKSRRAFRLVDLLRAIKFKTKPNPLSAAVPVPTNPSRGRLGLQRTWR